ncbi:MAG: myo-inositol 2-dehydrogenase / D-chiro-inositol 1-dehydrogenase [Solirubrobacteraceae bacterium]|jgi:myo-inositol 2-dehydrogenase/D-chiro-inositol 1-dehydrogenase|nr:myo-inositol 2-dehydrogenase / D-chiro-inositol 1-dehydrogenase [Solirubrobacteraceae bacterium]
MGLAVGVIGTGVMGSTHARTIATAVSGARLAAVSDVDADRAAAVAAGLGCERVHRDPYALIADPSVDAVLIVSSDATHVDFTLACLEAGKPVLCEKPLAPTAAACLDVVQAESALGRRLVQVGFMRRFDAGYAELKRMLDGGEIGAALMLHCVHRNPSVPPHYTSDMLITSSATHEIDVARWLLGEELVAATVHAPRSSSLAPDRLRDPQFVLLEGASGALIDVEVFVTARYGYDIRCEVVGERGTVSLAPPTRVLVRRDRGDTAPVPGDFRDRFADAYRTQFQAWVAALAAGGPQGPSAWDGYATAVVADACLESLATGARTAVALAPRPELYADARAGAVPVA